MFYEVLLTALKDPLLVGCYSNIKHCKIGIEAKSSLDFVAFVKPDTKFESC